MNLPPSVLQYGSAEARPERLPLRAGPWSLCFEAGDVRYVKWNGREVIRRIYAAVRDQNWGTVPVTLRHEQRKVAENSFRITYEAEHRQGDIHFIWRGEIVGEEDGMIRFTFDGEAKTTFLRNRIGFCVLHPIRECAGAPCRALYLDGTEKELAFPGVIAAEQPMGGLHDLAGLAHEIQPGIWAELRFDGDTFEMEDQRNWSDASFKTFCTPLRLPFPVEIRAGTHVRQSVTLRLLDGGSAGRGGFDSSIADRGVRSPEFSRHVLASDATVKVDLFPDQTLPLPPLGLGVASHGQPLTPREIELLSQLWLWHLRADIKLAASNWPDSFRLASAQAHALDLPLELAVHLPPAGGEVELIELTRLLRSSETEVARVTLFRDGEMTTSAGTFDFARNHFAFLECPVGAGTSADFYELNQSRPPHAQADFICWSLNPQVHAFDLASLAETPAAIRSQLESARVFFPGKLFVVGPVTLKPRFNPVATGPELSKPPGDLPAQVDPRQLSLFGAVWTLAAFKHLAEFGAESVTFYETTGWRGVIERSKGLPQCAKFPSVPGQVFPLYHVIGEINGFGRGDVIVSRSSDSLRVESLALTKKGWACLWLANLTAERQRVCVTGFQRATHLRHADWSLPNVWMFYPEAMLHELGPALTPPVEGELEIDLEPFGLARVELKLSLASGNP